MALPIPLFGVYSGTLIAELLKIRREHIVLSAVMGVVLGAALMFVLLGGISLAL